MIRRRFLASLVTPLLGAPRFSSDPFTQGIASGDPLPDGVVLWTRLTSPQLTESLEVEWIVAEDEGLKKIVKRGKEVATPQFAHTVHADVRGLKPVRWYWYQFRCGGVESRIGRTRTAPAPNSQDPLRFAFASCQNYEQGYFTAYEHMAKEDLHLVVHYVSCSVDSEEFKSEYRIVPTVTRPGSPIETRAKFVVQAGANRVEKA